MTVLAPADEVELRQCMRAALKLKGPAYIRIGKKGEEIIPKNSDAFEIGRSITVREGLDVCLIGTGTLMPELLKAAEILAEQGVAARVESCHTIKPIDQHMLSEVSGQYSLIAVIEEHSKIGGLGGSIAEWLASQISHKTRLISFGTDDEFMHEVGTQEYARAKYGLTANNIASKVLEAFRTI